jgi:regulator of sigma E protease
VSFIALLSVNLGLINLFPIPILDGGHLLFYLFEAIRGRPLPPQVQEYGTRAGLAILVALFLFATRNDLAANGLFRWIAGLLG